MSTPPKTARKGITTSDNIFVSLGSGLAVAITWATVKGEFQAGGWPLLTVFVASLAGGVATWFLRKICDLPSKQDVVEDGKTLNDASVPRNVEDRLDELERLKRRDMVTPEEYAAKRQEILKDL
jgi:hypothetical protein